MSFRDHYIDDSLRAIVCLCACVCCFLFPNCHLHIEEEVEMIEVGFYLLRNSQYGALVEVFFWVEAARWRGHSEFCRSDTESRDIGTLESCWCFCCVLSGARLAPGATAIKFW